MLVVQGAVAKIIKTIDFESARGQPMSCTELESEKNSKATPCMDVAGDLVYMSVLEIKDHRLTAKRGMSFNFPLASPLT